MPEVAVIIATRNRPEAIKNYALMSLERSEYKDFACVVWDASDDDRTAAICNAGGGGHYHFELAYAKAPRAGSCSQRNGGMRFALERWPDVKYLQFIDDDSEISSDCLGGMVETFMANHDVYGVGQPIAYAFDGNGILQGKYAGTPTTVVCACWPKFKLIDPNDKAAVASTKIDWFFGCAMAFRREVFTELKLHFPEAFERFGGYAYGEDTAFSAYLSLACKKKLAIAQTGTILHHAAPNGRLSRKDLGACIYWGHSLLVEAVYYNERGLRKAWLIFWGKFFAKRRAIGLKSILGLKVQGREEMIEGYRVAKAALKEPHEDLARNLIQDR